MEETRDEKHLEKKLKMISEKHRENARVLLKSGRKIRALGFWKGKNESGNFPHPQNFIDPDWDTHEKQMVIDYLKRGSRFIGFQGLSWCRFNCGDTNMGAFELTDGTYLWPEGLVHYLEKHDVRLPQDFVDHVRKNLQVELPEYADTDTMIICFLAPDLSWWKTQGK